MNAWPGSWAGSADQVRAVDRKIGGLSLPGENSREQVDFGVEVVLGENQAVTAGADGGKLVGHCCNVLTGGEADVRSVGSAANIG